MEKILERIEAFIEKVCGDFEKNPVKISVKLLIVYWIIKTVWKEVKR